MQDIKVGDRVYPWKELPRAIEIAGDVQHALNVVIKYLGYKAYCFSYNKMKMYNRNIVKENLKRRDQHG